MSVVAMISLLASLILGAGSGEVPGWTHHQMETGFRNWIPRTRFRNTWIMIKGKMDRTFLGHLPLKKRLDPAVIQLSPEDDIHGMEYTPPDRCQLLVHPNVAHKTQE